MQRWDRNCMDLTEAEDIKKRWEEKLYKKDLQDPDNHDGVITHIEPDILEPDILECEVKWALGSITTNKVRGGDGIPTELFKILKDDAVKVHSICQQIWKIQQWSQDWKRSVFIPFPKKGNAKECSDYYTVALINACNCKLMLKILQARLQQYVKCEIQNLQAGFRKDRGTRDQIANICWIIHRKSKQILEKTSTFVLLTMPKPLTVWITTNCGKFLKRWEYQTT